MNYLKRDSILYEKSYLDVHAVQLLGEILVVLDELHHFTFQLLENICIMSERCSRTKVLFCRIKYNESHT